MMSTPVALAQLLGDKSDYYKPKEEEVLAIRYDGTRELAEAVVEHCRYAEVDEIKNLDKFRFFASVGRRSTGGPILVEVDEGDYLIRRDGWFQRMGKKEFEERYKKMEYNE